ncbi:ROK family glucokinase [Bacillus sp. FJAT-50079]|uniref:ROK family glucokinase n=1 Tax=Bacillus sp. FJAT-50079 TaxID=2833577 RepID=UPI001BC9B379|nr:ROK family glucokinase [Bacillus sp. FJAT-50079]MBS4206643.1 ROK family glucokinase [Bacillus sp. FJAT-50079]
MSETIIGIDIGGTTVKIGFLNMQGDIIHKWEIETNKERQGFYIIDEIWNSVSSKITEFQITNILGIGVGAPGFVDKTTGIVYEAVNIGWKDFELGKELEKRSGLPVYVENDVNLVALAENWMGSGNKAKDLIAITLGTGVGSGVIANGEILNGMNGTAGEIGHIIADPEGYACNCGRVGCLDTIASATGIVNQAMDKIAENPESGLAALYHKQGILDAKDVFDLAKKGDTISESVINRTADILGFLIANAATMINPSKIIIGGGVSKAGEQLLQPVTRAFQKYSLPRISDKCTIEIAKLGNDAGMIGAAYLVEQETEEALHV